MAAFQDEVAGLISGVENLNIGAVGRSRIPECWTKFCIVLNGKSHSVSLFPTCVQFLLDKHRDRINKTLIDKKYYNIEILPKEHSLSLSPSSSENDEGDVLFEISSLFEEEIQKCKEKEESVPKNIEDILSAQEMHDYSAEVGIYHDKLRRKIKVVGFDEGKVEKVVKWLVQKVMQPLEKTENLKTKRHKEQTIEKFPIEYCEALLLQKKNAKEFIEQKLMHAGISCKFNVSFEDNSQWLLIKTDQRLSDLEKVRGFMKECWETKNYSNTAANLKDNTGWTELESKYKDKWAVDDVEGEEFAVCCTIDVAEEVKKEVNRMLTEICLSMKVDGQKYGFVKEKLSDKLLEIATKNEVKISTDKCHEVSFTGFAGKIGQAMKDLKELIGKVGTFEVKNIPEVMSIILKEDELDKNVQNMLGGDCDVFVQKNLEKVQVHHLRNWVDFDCPYHVCVMKGSPTVAVADMIVSPVTDCNFPIADGLEIFSKAGNDFLSKILANVKSKCSLGTHSIVKNLSNLKFQYVGCLCTTFSNLPKEKESPRVDLSNWIVKLLEDADKNFKIQSVVIPINMTNLLSSSEQMKEIAKVLKRIWKLGSKKHICEVYVCVTEDDKCKEVLNIFEKELKGISQYDFSCLLPDQSEHIDIKDRKNPIQMKVVKGSIEDQEVDVIVNAVSHDLDLTVGVISRKILKKAGKKLEEEMQGKKPLNIGEVLPTKSWDMKTCTAICHVAIPDWTYRTNFSLRVLQLVLWRCLLDGNRKGFSSIAFPALGCGKQEYPASRTAIAMMECVDEFGHKYPNTTIKTVQFIIFPKDNNVLQSFTIAERKHSQSIWRFKEMLPPEFLECKNSTKNGTVEIKTVYAGEKACKMSYGCDAVFDLHLTHKINQEVNPKPVDLKWLDEGMFGEVNIDAHGLKESLEKNMRWLWKLAVEYRLTSMVVCIRDLQGGPMDALDQLEIVKRSIYSKENPYTQVIWIVMTEAEHSKLLKKVSSCQEKQQKDSGGIFAGIIKNTIGVVQYQDTCMSEWKVTKPTYSRSLMVVGEKDKVRAVKGKIMQLENKLPRTKQDCWKYIVKESNYSDSRSLPSNICTTLSIADILGEDSVSLHTPADTEETPCFFDLKAMKCSQKDGLEQHELKKESGEDVVLRKDQEDDLYDGNEIFETVTGDINHCFAKSDNLSSVKQILVGCGLQLHTLTKAGLPYLQITGNFKQILMANEILLDESHESSGPSKERGDSTNFDELENVVSHEVDHFFYKALEYFYHDEETWKRLEVQWNEGKLLYFKKSSEDEKYINDLIHKVQEMKREDIKIPSPDKIETIQKKCLGKPDIYTQFDESSMVVTILGGNYEQILSLQQQINFELQGSKPRVDRRNRFNVSENNSSNKQQRSFKFAVDDNENSGTQSSSFEAFVDEFSTQENVKVKVYCASIMSLDVDCIVNAANENLSHGAGVAAAISNAAGYTLDQEGNEYIRRNGPLKVGTCCSTTAGNLTRYSCVIHTVGPRWSDFRDKNECRQVLRKSIYVCLVEASNRSLSSIGIPSISAGIFGVPKEVCAEEYFYAVTEFSEKYAASTTLKEVHFIDRDDQMIGLIRRVFQSGFDGKLPPPVQSSSRGSFSSSMSKKSGSFSQKITGSVDHSIFVFNEKIKIHVHKKDIIAMAVDGIVCPQNSEFSGHGQIAKAVYHKACEKYKNDVDGIERRPLMGETKTFDTYGSMPFRFVIHAVIQRWDKRINARFEFNLEKAIKNIFSTANSKGMKSLAIPLLGISSDGVDEPTNIFGNLLKKFLKDQLNFTIEEIHIVCFEESGHGIKIIQDLFHEDVYFKEEKYSHTDTTSNEKNLFGKTLRGESGIKEDCCICMDTCTEPKRLPCGHIFCKECIDMHFTYKPTCPSCNKVFGKLFGNQPDGSIRFKRYQSSLPGHQKCGTIEVVYHIYKGTQKEDHPNPGRPFDGITRSGLLPDNEDGRLVAKLLNVAFSRKLIFTIGRSRTTEKEGVVTWNDIHHKTRREGGPERFGYPDPTYLSRVLEELSVKGVTLESADNPEEYREFRNMY